MPNVIHQATETWKEWRFVAAIIAAALLLTLVPYVLGYAQEQQGAVFTGVIMNPEDSQSYFAKMLQGYNGQWLYTIPFTTEEHAPAFVGGFYLALGQSARWLGLSLETMWHVARVLAGLLMYVAAFAFVAEHLAGSRERKVAYVLAVFGSGLGWVLFMLNQPYWLGSFPVDFKMAEAHLFFAALTFPHVEFGTACILVSLLAVRRAVDDQGGWRLAIVGGLANLALVITYPFLIVLIAATMLLYWLLLCVKSRRVLWRQALAFAAAFIIPAPLLLCYAQTLTTNPAFRAWEAQAATPSPPLPHFLVAYGVMLLLGGLHLLRRTQDKRTLLLWAWVAAAAVLVFFPFNAQRRFVQGVQVPLAILAVAGLFDVVLPKLEQARWFRRLAIRRGYSVAGLEGLLLVTFLLFMSLSNLYVLASVSITASFQRPYPLFRPREEIEAVQWLRNTTAGLGNVLSDYETGNYVAAQAGNRVVLGHWAETIDQAKKSEEVARFYSGAMADASRLVLLERYRVKYIWWGTRERELGDFDPRVFPYLHSAYSNATVTIYEYSRPE